MTEIEKLEQAIAALEAQRAVLGDQVLEIALAPLHEKLRVLRADRPTTPLSEQRKQVTVLFADVHGFTAMAESLDPEDIGDQMNELWAGLDQVLISHGAVIDKHIGDAVMALFGTPAAHEDDPERAVRAALEMQAKIREHALTQPAFPLQIRIGINTGPVLLGEVGSQHEYTAMGDTVNLAARLETSAPVAGILISHYTYRHIRGLFDLQIQAPLLVKGKIEPVQTYLVLQARPRAFRLQTRGIEGVETRMIGRQAELASLQTALQSVMSGRRQQVITVVGEAGVGKSRLLYEFTTWAELLPENWRIFKGRANEATRQLPYALLRDIFAFRFEISESDPLALAREKLERGVAGFMPDDVDAVMKAHFIGHLLGFDFSASPYLGGILQDVAQIRDRAFHYLTQFFAAVTREKDLDAVVLFLEDIHWADDGSLDAFEYFIQNGKDIPVFVLCFARPSLYERRPEWAAGSLCLTLQALSESESDQLVAEILKKLPDIPQDLRKMIVSRSEGNPFYVEELIKVLIDAHAILPAAEEWRVVPERLAAVHIPATLTGILQTRLDSLAPPEREALQRAAVLGRVFWDNAVDFLEHFSAAPDTAATTASSATIFQALRQKELIYSRSTSAFAGSDEYIFKHGLLRDVTYETVLKRIRRSYHALSAEWLIEQSGERVNEYAALIAGHYENSDQRLKAIEWYRRAGEQAADSYAAQEAIAHYQKALDLSRELPGANARWAMDMEIRLRLGAIFDLLGSWEEAENNYRSALVLAKRLPPHAPSNGLAQIARCQKTLGRLFFNRGDYGTALIWLDQARVIWQKIEDQTGLGQALIEIGNVFSRQGDYPAAKKHLEQGLSTAQLVNDRRSMALALNILGNIASEQGDDIRASELYTQSMAIRKELGDKRSITDTLNNLANIAVNRGDLAGGKKLYEECLMLNREMGYKWGMAVSLNNLGNVAYTQADYDRALPFFDESLALMRQIGDKWGVANALIDLGLLDLARGQILSAGAFMSESLSLCQEMGDKRGILFCLIGLAGAASSRGDHRHAARLSAAAEKLMISINVQLEPEVRPVHEKGIAAARLGLGEQDFEACWSAGQALSLEEMVVCALEPGSI